ncbi:MAG: GtrA family protein, partial [Candidatus Chaera renei]
FKYNLAGTAFFWSTYGGFFVLNAVLGFGNLPSLAMASLFGHAVFFLLDKTWVFDQESSRRRTGREMTRFAAFMALNYVINIGIVIGLAAIGITPYIGQFVAAAFFTFWSFAGLKWWVFKPRLVKRRV